MEDLELYERAKKRVETRIGFYIHLFVYLAVNTLLIIVNLTASPGYYWFKWPLLGWGIGLLLHGIGVFASSIGSSVKERMIQKEMKKESLKK
jgi:2TM domain